MMLERLREGNAKAKVKGKGRKPTARAKPLILLYLSLEAKQRLQFKDLGVGVTSAGDGTPGGLRRRISIGWIRGRAEFLGVSMGGTTNS
jgi:hypothetical protein